MFLALQTVHFFLSPVPLIVFFQTDRTSFQNLSLVPNPWDFPPQRTGALHVPRINLITEDLIRVLQGPFRTLLRAIVAPQKDVF